MRGSIMVFFILFSATLFGKLFPGYFVHSNGDTIKCKFDVSVNWFNDKLINQLSFNKKIKIVENKVTTKYAPHQLKMFLIDSTSEGSEKYVPLVVDNKLRFVRVALEGKVNLYEHFFPHGYDGSVQQYYVVVRPGSPSHVIPLLFWKKKLTKYFEGDKWLLHEINKEGRKHAEIPFMFLEYNKLFK